MTEDKPPIYVITSREGVCVEKSEPTLHATLARLDRLINALVEDILSASDEDVLAEFRDAHGDPDHHADEMREMFERAALTGRTIAGGGGRTLYDGAWGRTRHGKVVRITTNEWPLYPFRASLHVYTDGGRFLNRSECFLDIVEIVAPPTEGDKT